MRKNSPTCNIALIPARGGSNRVPRKNIREFNGKPLIAWSIAAAQSSGLFERIIVSTDDEEIGSISKEYGAEVPFKRPPELSNDFTGTDAVVSHALDWLVEQKFVPDFICCIYPTAPFSLARQSFKCLMRYTKVKHHLPSLPARLHIPFGEV